MIKHRLDGAAEETFRALLEAAPDAIVVVASRGEIVLVNAQAERLFGYERDELLGESVELLVPERSRAAHRADRDGYLADPHTRAMGAGLELHGRRRDGSEFPVEICLSPVQTAAGLLVSSAIRDVSERKQAERELAQAHEALAAVRQRAAFVASMNHEIRTPLNGIIGMTNLLRQTELAGPQDEYVETLAACGDALAAAISEVLDSSEFGTGADNRSWLAPEPVRLQDVRVLIVDDNATNRTIFEHYLKSWGLACDSASLPLRALAMLESASREGAPYDVALLDFEMPQMGGDELAREIAGRPSLRDTKLVMLSSRPVQSGSPR